MAVMSSAESLVQMLISWLSWEVDNLIKFARKLYSKSLNMYEKVKEAEVVSTDDYDRSKYYYDDQFFRDI